MVKRVKSVQVWAFVAAMLVLALITGLVQDNWGTAAVICVVTLLVTGGGKGYQVQQRRREQD